MGLDISLGMLKQCQKKIKRLKREITLIQAGGREFANKK